MGLEVRAITDDEHEPWMDAMAVGFLSRPVPGTSAWAKPFHDLARSWAAFDGSRVVGTLRSFAAEVTVPGGAFVPAAALTSVTVTATHRRQGLLRRMIEPDLAASKERGEPVGILIAAEYPIYGRFGYGPATGEVELAVDASVVEFRHERPGHMELVDHATLRKEGPPLYERFRAAQPGTIERSDRWWDVQMEIAPRPGDDPFKGFVGLYRNEGGEPEGYVRYTIDAKWDAFRPNATVVVDELLAVTPDAYQRLWRYCCEIDWVATVTAGRRATDEVLPWLVTNGRHVAHRGRTDFMWLRPLDVPTALTARRYHCHGRLVIDVQDSLGLANGRFAIDGGPDGADCRPTTEAAALTLNVGELGALYLGGPAWATLAAAGRLDVHDHRALATADAMFRSPVAPWCNTIF
jgi:predicted acetyltransferase